MFFFSSISSSLLFCFFSCLILGCLLLASLCCVYRVPKPKRFILLLLYSTVNMYLYVDVCMVLDLVICACCFVGPRRVGRVEVVKNSRLKDSKKSVDSFWFQMKKGLQKLTYKNVEPQVQVPAYLVQDQGREYVVLPGSRCRLVLLVKNQDRRWRTRTCCIQCTFMGFGNLYSVWKRYRERMSHRVRRIPEQVIILLEKFLTKNASSCCRSLWGIFK